VALDVTSAPIRTVSQLRESPLQPWQRGSPSKNG
jgi:hypothetical protein